jgi:hypothetical protein
MQTFLAPSIEPRDVENSGSRFWSTEPPDDDPGPFGSDTLGVVDENEGGIVAYVHRDNADRVIAAFRAFAGEV